MAFFFLIVNTVIISYCKDQENINECRTSSLPLTANTIVLTSVKLWSAKYCTKYSLINLLYFILLL